MRKSPIVIILLLISYVSVSSADNVQEYIRSTCESLMENRPIIVDGNRIFSTSVLPTFYMNRDFTRAWLDTKNIEDALTVLKESENDGLNPEDYHYSMLKDFWENYTKKTDIEKAQFDILMTDAGILYAHHLIVGKVNPENLDAQWNYRQRQINMNPVELIQQALTEKKIPQFIEKIKPHNRYYTELVKAFEKYKDIAKKGGWPVLPEGKIIKPGDEDSRIPLIRERLWITGDLAYTEALDSKIADDTFVAAVKHFQLRHGLSDDGKIGKGTIKEMNIPVAKRIDQIRVNLERSRWVLGNLSEKFVIVNIASFQLWYMENKDVRFHTNVVVGKQFHETPVFKDLIRYIVINPTWTVPRSILRDEMFHKIKRDYHYLAKRNYSLVDYNGNVVDPSKIDWANMTFSKFKWMVRQEPGPTNALGRIKFMFPNKYSIYLHDTPSKSLFQRSERDFSHGCVRVQNPIDLAVVLLDNDQKWSKETINKIIQTKKTTSVKLKEPIPVLILYWTAISREGMMYFSNDVYKRDAKVLKALNSSSIDDTRKAYSEEIKLK